MAYNTEKDLVIAIRNSPYIKGLTSSENSYIDEEVGGLFGIPDLVVAKSDNNGLLTFAYEAKLTNWKRALVQAYKYKAFAKRSYVILDYDHITSALSNRGLFINSNIGLISINSDGKMYFHNHPYVDEPYSPQLERKFNCIMTNGISSNRCVT
jgi:hypothetical protein